jgi:hypothetical protein
MPLRVVRDGIDIIAPNLSDEVWEEFRRTKPELILPCCGARAVSKLSPLGLRFFAHRARKPDDHRCDWKPESEVHVTAKMAILHGCRDAGWNATPEVAAEDGTWRADVLGNPGHGEGRAARRVRGSVEPSVA